MDHITNIHIHREGSTMVKRYGVPYKGSKNQLCEWLLSYLPSSPVFVDLFAGGCSVTHKAMETGKYKSFVINDLGGAPQLFLDAVNGKYENETRWISREDFQRLKDSDDYVKYCWSFGNNGENYLYAKEIEPWKKALHYSWIYGDDRLFEEYGIHTDGSIKDLKDNIDEYKQRYTEWYSLKYFGTTKTAMLKEKELTEAIATESERLRLYLCEALKQSGLKQSDVNKRLNTQMAGHYFGKSQWAFPTKEEYTKMQTFLPLPEEYDDIHGLAELLEATKQLQSLQSLQSLQRIQGYDITLLKEDYRDVSIPEASFYYCDPPYRNTTGYGFEFDFNAFDTWLNTVDKPVIVSEYTAPAGTVEIARKEHRTTLSASSNNTKTVEKLFIQKKYLDWYNEQMEGVRLL